MITKKHIKIGLMLYVLLMTTACTKKIDATNESLNQPKDRYCCVMFEQLGEKESENYDYLKCPFPQIIEDGGRISDIKTPEGYSVMPSCSEIYTDSVGRIHIANAISKYDGSIKKSYIVLKNEEVIFKQDLDDSEGIIKLIVLPDEKVAADITQSHKDGRIIHEVIQYEENITSCKVICQYSTAEVIKDDEIVSLNVFDDKHLIYMTCTGIFMSDYNLKNEEKIYDWHRNGVSFSNVASLFSEYRISADDSGNIYVLKDGFRCNEYLKLSRIPEDVVTVEIAGYGGMRAYMQAMFDFNIKHPEYHISIRDDYDKTILLTKIIAGEGPEIIEEGMIDVRAAKDAWEPLENLVSKATIENLNEGAVTCGSVDYKLVGASPSYTIDTLVTGEELSKWNYEDFLNTVNSNPNLVTLTSSSLLEGKLPVFLNFFCDGIEDTYFIDFDGVEAKVNKEKLEEIVSLIDKYQTGENYDRGLFDMVSDKSMLCTKFWVSRPIDLYSILYAFGDRGNVIGYPGKEGSKFYLNNQGTLFVRKNISEEKKRIISEFFEYMLSYEGQKRTLIDGGGFIDGFSARDDVLKEQIDEIKSREGEPAGLGGVMFTYENIDPEIVREKMGVIMDNSLPARDWNDPFYDILSEELGNYFAGSMDIDTLYDHLNKRIGLYVKEKY